METAAIALGSNLSSAHGSPRENVLEAVERVAALGRVGAVSTLVETAAEIYLEQPRFVNGAMLLETALGPVELMRALLGIEVAMGRVRTGVPAKGPRVIDLDLIFFGAEVLESEELILPHPGMAERGFVLGPLAEIAPEWRHPGLGRTVVELLAVVGRGGGVSGKQERG